MGLQGRGLKGGFSSSRHSRAAFCSRSYSSTTGEFVEEFVEEFFEEFLEEFLEEFFEEFLEEFLEEFFEEFLAADTEYHFAVGATAAQQSSAHVITEQHPCHCWGVGVIFYLTLGSTCPNFHQHTDPILIKGGHCWDPCRCQGVGTIL